MEIVTTVQPASEPITLSEAKTHLRVTATDEDDYISSLVSAARLVAEGRTGLRLFTQTVVISLDDFPCYNDIIKLAVAPVQSITSVEYYDTDDANQTLGASTYWSDLTSVPARVQVKESWPSTISRIGNVRITAVVGWTDVANIPASVKHAMKLLVGHWYENREESISGTIITNIPEGINSLFMSVGGEYQNFSV